MVKSRIEEARKFLQVILGPRQVGKTTIVTQLLSQVNIPNLYESQISIQEGSFDGKLYTIKTSASPKCCNRFPIKNNKRQTL